MPGLVPTGPCHPTVHLGKGVTVTNIDSVAESIFDIWGDLVGGCSHCSVIDNAVWS